MGDFWQFDGLVGPIPKHGPDDCPGQSHQSQHAGHKPCADEPGEDNSLWMSRIIKREHKRGPHDLAVEIEGRPRQDGEGNPSERDLFFTGDDHVSL